MRKIKTEKSSVAKMETPSGMTKKDALIQGLPWRRKIIKGARFTPPGQRREDDDRLMHQISVSGQRRDKLGERIVQSECGALGICETKRGSVYCEPKKREPH